MKLIKWCLAYANGESKDEFTPAQILKFSSILLGLCHLLILLLFLYAQVYFMVIVNIFSILTYIGCYFIAMRDNYPLFFSTVYIEVSIHITLATIMIGDQSGFTMHWIAILSILYMCCYGYRTLDNTKNKYNFKPAIFIFISAVLFIALRIHDSSIGPIHPLTDETIYHLFFFMNYIITMMAVVVSLSIFITQALNLNNRLIQQNSLLEVLSTTDTLTGLSNRRIVTDFFGRAAAEHIPFCVILGDIDDFKKINDTYGHDCGDKALISVASIFKACIRKTDIICRWGGEEILVVLPECDTANAKNIALKIKQTLNNTTISYNDKKITISMTFGISSSDDAPDTDGIVQIANSHLYYGKAHGKNCVITSEEAAKQ